MTTFEEMEARKDAAMARRKATKAARDKEITIGALKVGGEVCVISQKNEGDELVQFKGTVSALNQHYVWIDVPEIGTVRFNSGRYSEEKIKSGYRVFMWRFVGERYDVM